MMTFGKFVVTREAPIETFECESIRYGDGVVSFWLAEKMVGVTQLGRGESVKAIKAQSPIEKISEKIKVTRMHKPHDAVRVTRKEMSVLANGGRR